MPVLLPIIFFYSLFHLPLFHALPIGNNGTSLLAADSLLNNSEEAKMGIHEVVGGEFVEVRRVLDEIRIASIKKHGLFSDEDPTRMRERGRYRERVTFDDGTEATINREVAEDLFENDILLTLPQAEHILKEVQESPKLRRGKRQANPSLSSFWENLTIPYIFQLSQTNTYWKNSIRAAHRHIESLTCIKFRYFESDYDLKGKDFLQYFRGTGCWSQVGRTGGRQPVSIGYGCEALGIVAHETLHALGLWHEQSRTDRDSLIRINLDAIMPGTESNFEKRTPYTSDNMGQPYDLGSAMHYGSKAFSTDARTYTILTQDRAYQQTIGQRGGLSFKDAKMINIRYCKKNCEYQIDCENGGYTDPLKCGQCRCPDGYTGMYCQQIPETTHPACKSTGEMTAGQWAGSISTELLPRGQYCYWRIHPQYPNQRVELSLKRLSFPCKDACISFLEVKYKKDKVSTGARLCCDVPATIYSDIGTDVLLILKTEEALDPGYEGFELHYKTVDGDATIPTTQPIGNTTEPISSSTSPQPTSTIPELSTTEGSTSERTSSSSSSSGTTTTTVGPDGKEEGWSEWAKWSGCSATCGACGQKKRLRACNAGIGKCKGFAFELERCGLTACPLPMQSTRCSGRLVMPCNLLQQLDFGTVLNYDSIRHHHGNNVSLDDSSPSLMVDSNIVVEESQVQEPSSSALLQTENNAQILRRHRRNPRRATGRSQRAQFCEKRFTYHCPTTLLTISMDWQVPRDEDDASGNELLSPSADSQHRCCAGYTAIQGECVKKSTRRA